MSKIPRQASVLHPVSAPFVGASPPTANGADASTQSAATPTGVAVTKVLGALLLLLPLVGCNDHSLTALLNGGSASATSQTDPTPYVPGNTATQAQINRLPEFAPGQSTQAMHSVLGSPDSYDRYHDYYRTADGGMIAVPYDQNGHWTGTIEAAQAPQWQPSPYPGVQP